MLLSMRKLLVVAILIGAALAGWRYQHRAATSARRNLALNRFWVDHLPTNERDPFNVFVISAPEGIGAFAEETQWRGQIERFRFDIAGDVVHAVFPWSKTSEDITLHARACREHGMDYCLDVSGSTHGVTRYYSLTGWERKDAEDADAFVSRILTLNARS